MKITVENTSKIVELTLNGATFPARIWEGTTETGTPVHCFITRIVPEVHETDPRIEELTAEFERELKRTASARAETAAIPMRLII